MVQFSRFVVILIILQFLTNCKVNQVKNSITSLRLIKLKNSDSPIVFVDTIKTSGYAYFNRHADDEKVHDWHFEAIFKFDKNDTIINSITDFYINDENCYFYEGCQYIFGAYIDSISPKLHDYTLKHNLISDCRTGAYMNGGNTTIVNDKIVKKKVSGFFMICLLNNDFLVNTIQFWNKYAAQPGHMSPMPDFSKYKSMLRPLGKEYYIPAVIFVTDKW